MLLQDILNEAVALVNAGYKEIVLTGIHVGGYGKDLGDYSFSDLVEDISDICYLIRVIDVVNLTKNVYICFCTKRHSDSVE